MRSLNLIHNGKNIAWGKDRSDMLFLVLKIKSMHQSARVSLHADMIGNLNRLPRTELYCISWIVFHQAEDTTTNCTLCDKKFGGLVTRKHCSFCRGTICKACSDKNVILYVPDEDKETVQISVIKVIGVSTARIPLQTSLDYLRSQKPRLFRSALVKITATSGDDFHKGPGTV